MSIQVSPKTAHIIQAHSFMLGECHVPKSGSVDSIGQRITRFRKDKGMTQQELAAALDVTQPVVSDYEHDVIRIPADVVAQLSAVLKVSSDEILGLKSDRKTGGGVKNRRLSRRLQAIDSLPKRDQEALLRTIDAFISKT